MSSWKWLQRNKIIFTAFIVWLCVFELFSKCLVGIGQTNIISFYSGNENSNKLYKCFKKHLAYLFQNLFLIEIALSLNYFTVYLMFFFLNFVFSGNWNNCIAMPTAAARKCQSFAVCQPNVTWIIISLSSHSMSTCISLGLLEMKNQFMGKFYIYWLSVHRILIGSWFTILSIKCSEMIFQC